MKVNESLSILFLPKRPEANKEGFVPIYTRITINGQRKEFSLGFRILPGQWDADNVRVIGSSKESIQINSQIIQTRAKLEKHYLILSAQFAHVTTDMLKKAYEGKSVCEEDEKSDKKSMLEAFTIYITRFGQKVNSNNRSKRTLQKWNTTKDKMAGFIQHAFNKQDIPLEQIKQNGAEDMYHYLTTVDALSHNSAMKYIRNCRQVFKFAVGRWITTNPFTGFICNYIQPGRDILTMPEIINLYHQPLSDRLDKVRDCFLFSCFTGLAYQELALLSPGDIIAGNDGYKWIAINRVKTGNPENVPLLPIPETIIEKCKKEVEFQISGRLLPVISNQKYNDYLKDLASACKINKYLTTHTGRHTFATTVCLENGVPIETVSKMLGHSSIKITQIYAKITTKKTSDDMKDLRKRLFSPKGKLREEKHAIEPILRIRQMNEEIIKVAG